jgi:cytidylate kinase
MDSSGQVHNAIAIDGPAASGKSTVARQLAARLGYLYVNSGEMYRAVTWALLQRDIALDRTEEVMDALGSIKIECGSESGRSQVRVNGEDPAEFLSSEEVNRNVSVVSAIAEVRRIIVEKLVAYRELDHVVMEGRDIGSVVFPDSKFKFYVDASEEVRNARRRLQGLEDAISERDRRDQTRKASPLFVSEDAHRIDSSEMTPDEVVD